MTSISFEEALSKAQRFCSYRERCRSELITKLKTLHCDKAFIPKILEKLTEDDFLNEKRFIRSFINGKLNHNKWGQRKIVFELKQKGINNDLIEKEIAIIHPEEYKDIAKDLIDKYQQRNSTIPPHILKEKIFRYMTAKGFEFEMIQGLIQ